MYIRSPLRYETPWYHGIIRRNVSYHILAYLQYRLVQIATGSLRRVLNIVPGIAGGFAEGATALAGGAEAGGGSGAGECLIIWPTPHGVGCPSG